MADGTQYLIDIAAKMTGGESAISQLQDVAARMTGVGTAAQTLDQALAQATAHLSAASEASAAAAAAVGAGSTRYNQLERAAVNAAKAVERASLKGGVPPGLAEKATAAATALRAEAVSLDALKAKAASAAAEETKLAAAVKATAATAAAVPKVNELGEAFGKLGGPIGAAGQKTIGLFNGLSKLGAGAGPIGLAAIAAAALTAAVVALAAAVAVAAVKTALWAVGLADAARNSGLATEALVANNAALGGLAAILPGVTAATGQTADQVRALAVQLADAGVKAADMPAALRAAATAEAALGQGGAAKLIADLKAGKKSATELAAEIDQKFGGIVSKKMLGLDAQVATLKTNLSATFGGLKIDGLLAGLSKLIGLLDTTTASGRTIKFLFETLFQPLIDAAVAAFPVIEGFILGVEIGALKLYIAFKPAIKAVKDLFGGADSKLPDAIRVATVLGKAFTLAIAAGVATVAVLVAGLALLAAPLIMTGVLAIKAFSGMRSAAAGASSVLAGLPARIAATNAQMVSIGLGIARGIASGITAGAAAVLSAIGGVVQGAISKAKSMLGIASPSKVFHVMGQQTGEGFGGGVDKSAPSARSALETLVAPPSAPAARGGGGGPSLDMHGAIFNFYGVEGSEDSERRFGELMTHLLEGDITQLGGGAPAGA